MEELRAVAVVPMPRAMPDGALRDNGRRAASPGWRRSGWRSFGWAILASLLLLGGCDSVESTAEQHQQRALEMEAAGDLRGAVLEWKNALQKEPSNASARLHLGRVSLELDDLATARSELQRAAGLGMDRVLLAPSLARLWLMEAEPGRVLDELDPADFKTQDATVQATILTLRGEAFAALDRPAEALQSFEEALAHAPDHAPAHVGIAAGAMAQRRPEAARAPLHAALDLNPRLHQAWNLLGDLERAEGRLEAAEAAYGSAIEHRTPSLLLHLKRASTRLARQDLPAAQEDLAALRRLDPDHPVTFHVQGLVHYYQGHFAEAQTAFEEALRSAPDFPPAVVFLAASQFAQQHWHQAARHLERFLRAHPESDEATQLLAIVRLREGDLVRAEALLRPLLERDPDDVSALKLMGDLHLARGDAGAAVDHLRRLAAIRSDDATVRMALAAGLMRTGEHAQALRELELAMEQAPGQHQPLVAYGVSLIQLGEYDRALGAVTRLMEALPDDPIPYNLRAAAYLGKGDIDEARAALLEALRVAPGDTDAASNLAQIALQHGDREEARRVYREVLRQHPAHVELTLRLAQLEAEDGDLAAMLALLEALVLRQPAALAPRLMLSRYHLSQGEPRQALALLEPLRRTATGDTQVLTLLARALLEVGQAEEAVAVLDRHLARHPEADAVRFLLAEIRLTLPDHQAALREYERLIGRHPENLILLNNLAFLYQAAGDPRALEYAERAYARAPEAPEVASTLGWILVQRGEIERGYPLLKAARNALPDRPEVRYHYAVALEKAQRMSEARAEATALLEAFPAFSQRSDAEALLGRLHER